MSHNLSQPERFTITGPQGETYRGGNQEWYRDLWQRRAGCGPTTAATLLAYLSQTHPSLAPLRPLAGGTRTGFAQYMQARWPYVTPGARGLDKPESLVLGCRSFALSRGCVLQGEILKIPRRRENRPSPAACRDFLIQAQLFRGARRKLFVNHVKLKTAGKLSEILQTVLFCPEDLALIKAGAAERRTFLDRAICQLRPRYAEALSQYQKLLDHKTRILRDWEKNPSLLEVLEDFNEAMARAGALVIHYRAHFIRKLAEKAQVIQREFSGGGEELALSYQTVRTVTDPLGPTVTLYEALREHQNSHRRAELEAKSCLSGPHKDDLLAAINGQPARQFASQGQTRTAALSLKLAEREIFQEDTGQWPILLLDDVLSELDQRRQDFVLGRITGGQVFITGCQPPEAGTFPGNSLHIVQGTLVDAGAADDLA